MAFGLHHLLCYPPPKSPACAGDLSLRSNRGYGGGNGDYREIFTINPITPISPVIPKLFLAQSKLLSYLCRKVFYYEKSYFYTT